MIESSSDGSGPRRLSRRLMLFGLGIWTVSIAGALAPRLLRAIVYPIDAEASSFELVAAPPLGATVLWTGLVVWCVSWAFVMGHLAAAWSARRGRPSWATAALFLVSPASPLVFGLAVSVLLRLATGDAFRGSGIVPFLPALVLQLVISRTYSFMTGLRPRARPQRSEAA